MKILISVLCSVLAFAQEANEKPANVKELGFKYGSGQSTFEIEFDKDVTFEKNVSEADKQVILEFKNAKIAKKWQRRLDTSQHKSNISLISPYQSSDYVRVVLQLKDNGSVEVSQDGKKVIARIDNKQPGEKKEDLTQSLSDPSSVTASPDASKPEESEPAPAPAPVASAGTPAAATPNESAANDSLEGFFTAQQTKKYFGKRIFIQVREAELTDVFRIISEASEFNIAVSDSVKGKITLNLTDVPWDQALDLILHSHRLSAERSGNILRITTTEALTAEKEAEVKAKKAEEAAEPLVVKIFPISYATAEDLSTIIKDFLSKEVSSTSATGVSTAAGSLRGSIQVDKRTNSLVIRDTPSTMEKVKRIIQELDAQTPQILIEAKFVEVSEDKLKTVEGRIFASSREFDALTSAMTFRGTNNNYGALFGGTKFSALDPSFAISGPAGGASFGFQPKVGLLPGLSEIGAFLSILESESSGKVIASPRVVTQNKKPANIFQGQTIILRTIPGANSSGTVETRELLLKLVVEPQVTNDGNIALDIDFSQESLAAGSVGIEGAAATNKKGIKNRVMVDSGATLVIGGVYQTSLAENASGIPFLRELPIIGALFGSKSKTESKSELFIFLTPRVINEKEAGLKG